MKKTGEEETKVGESAESEAKGRPCFINVTEISQSRYTFSLFSCSLCFLIGVDVNVPGVKS